MSVGKKKYYYFSVIGFNPPTQSLPKKQLNVTGKIELNSEGFQNDILPFEFIHRLEVKNTQLHGNWICS